MRQILAYAHSLRRPGVAEGVSGLFGEWSAPLRPFARPEDDYRVLQSAAPPALRLGTRTAASAAEFRGRWAAAAFALAGFDLGAHGLVAAGGAPAAVLMGSDRDGPFEDAFGRKQTPFSDIDLFLVGHADDAARAAAVAALHRHLAAAKALLAHRTKGAVTWTFGNGHPPVQVVLRGYATLAEVLHGFDLGAPQVAFDGAEVWVTRLGRLAAERGLILVDLSVRRCSFERRLARYFARGYWLFFGGLREDDLARIVRAAAVDAATSFPLGCFLRVPGAGIWSTPQGQAPEARSARPRLGAVAGALAPSDDSGLSFDLPKSAAPLVLAGESAVRDEAGPGPAPVILDYSEIVGAGVPMGDYPAICLWNLRVATLARLPGTEFDPAHLYCAAGFPEDVASPLELELVLPGPEDFARKLRTHFVDITPSGPARPARLESWQLASLIPGDAESQAEAFDLWLHGWRMAAKEFEPAARRILARLAAKVDAEGTWRLPAGFAPVGDRTALSGDPHFAVSFDEWWGRTKATDGCHSAAFVSALGFERE
jgi:hypothetical protein